MSFKIKGGRLTLSNIPIKPLKKFDKKLKKKVMKGL